MEIQPAAKLRAPIPTHGEKFSWPWLALWLIAGTLVGLAAAWVAQIGQTYFAPLLIFPLLNGIAVGAIMVGLTRVLQIGHRPTIVLGTVLAVILTVVGQHYLGYLAAYHWPAPAVRALMPSFAEFLCRQADQGRPLAGDFSVHGWLTWLTWAIDALLTLLASLAMLLLPLRQPYCNRCRSWYHTVRAGRVDVPDARQMAEWTGLATVEQPKRARYRLACCKAGCGPTRLELSWEAVDGGILTVRTWLDNELRNRVNQLLDDAATRVVEGD